MRRAAAVLAAASLLAWGPVAAQPGLPAHVAEVAGTMAPLGHGDMRWLGLKIYEAALWVPAGSGWSADAPHALALRYARAIPGARLVDTSLEEMARLGQADPARLEPWRAALSRVFPSVAPGDTLVGLHLPGRGAWFWHGERATGRIDDPDLARAFFAIWLDPRTREPGLRARLLGLS